MTLSSDPTMAAGIPAAIAVSERPFAIIGPGYG